ncbi:MAG: 2-oxoglutarate ferredoxin oxidoreductase subunit gamma, partial [Desulfurella sp.]
GYPIVKTAKYDIGNVVTANILAVGMTVELTGILDKENVKKAIADRVPPAFLDLNMKAYETGIEIAKKLKAEKGK